MAHYKKQYGVSGEMLTATYFLMKGFNVFQPLATGTRDLLVEIDDKFYGVQVKSGYKPWDDPNREKKRFKFNLKHSSTEDAYDPELVQIFACVNLMSNLIVFLNNTGNKKTLSIRPEEFTQERQDTSFDETIKKIK